MVDTRIDVIFPHGLVTVHTYYDDRVPQMVETAPALGLRRTGDAPRDGGMIDYGPWMPCSRASR
ncbi:MAG TPA: hypothetical protein VFN67_02560 [Polyangiales bacterium]|nr:hypothetical protein [Polyangiales bacterium]